MKSILLILLIGLNISLAQAQNSGGPFTPNAPATPPGNNRIGGGGSPDDFLPPPDPIDTPLDSGIIFLLIIGTAYGVTKMGKNSRHYLLKRAA